MKIIILFLSVLFVACSTKSDETNVLDTIETASGYVSVIVQPEHLHFLSSGVSNIPTTFTMAADSLPENQKLVFACNGGMYMENYRPVGLFIKDGIISSSICSPTNSKSNYNLGFGEEKVNGIFMIDIQGNASIIKSSSYNSVKTQIQQATQSGPIILWEKEINPNFTENSTNRKRRNGVGVTPDGKVVFIMADDICFYDFALLFRDKYHCQNALFLDGVVSQTYLPSKGLNSYDGNFGVVIYVGQ